MFSLYRASMTAAADGPSDNSQTSSPNFGAKSYITDNDDMAADIHHQNVEQLQKMDTADIMEQRNLLLSSLDPDLVKFLQSKRLAAPPPQPMDVISGKVIYKYVY